MELMNEKYLNIIEVLIETHMAFVSINDKEIVNLANTFLKLIQERYSTEKEERTESITSDDLIAIQKILIRSRAKFKGTMIL